jgi:hypothetical protein
MSKIKRFRMNTVLFIARLFNVPIDVQGQFFPRRPCAPCTKPSVQS